MWFGIPCYFFLVFSRVYPILSCIGDVLIPLALPKGLPKACSFCIGLQNHVLQMPLLRSLRRSIERVNVYVTLTHVRGTLCTKAIMEVGKTCFVTALRLSFSQPLDPSVSYLLTLPLLYFTLLYLTLLYFTYLPTYVPTYLPTYLSTYLPTYLPTYLLTYLLTYFSTSLLT